MSNIKIERLIERENIQNEKDFICNLCSNILFQPTIICQNNHAYCLTCVINEHKADPDWKECNECNSPINFNQLKISEGYNESIGSLKVTCIHRARGCTWIGNISEEPKHLSNECSYKSEKCAACSAIYAQMDRSAHNSVCPKAKITCPRGGSNCSKFNRDRQSYHDTKCTYWSCDNVKVGCKTTGTLENLKLHVPYCTSLHQSRLTIHNAFTLYQKQSEDKYAFLLTEYGTLQHKFSKSLIEIQTLKSHLGNLMQSYQANIGVLPPVVVDNRFGDEVKHEQVQGNGIENQNSIENGEQGNGNGNSDSNGNGNEHHQPEYRNDDGNGNHQDEYQNENDNSEEEEEEEEEDEGNPKKRIKLDSQDYQNDHRGVEV